MDDEPGPFYNREGLILTGSVFQTDTFKTLFVDHLTSLTQPFFRWVTGQRIPLKLCSNWQAILILTVAQFFTSSVFVNHFWIMCWILAIPFSRDDSISQFWEPVLTIDCQPVCLALNMQVLRVDIITISVGFSSYTLGDLNPQSVERREWGHKSFKWNKWKDLLCYWLPAMFKTNNIWHIFPLRNTVPYRFQTLVKESYTKQSKIHLWIFESFKLIKPQLGGVFATPFI